jgi:hypothetical protein
MQTARSNIMAMFSGKWCVTTAASILAAWAGQTHLTLAGWEQTLPQPVAPIPPERTMAPPQTSDQPSATPADMVRMETHMQETNQRLLKQLGEARSAQSDRQVGALADVIQQMLLEQRQLIRYLAANRQGVGASGEAVATGTVGGGEVAAVVFDERGLRPLTAEEMQSVRVDRNGRVFGILDPGVIGAAGTVNGVPVTGAVPSNQPQSPGANQPGNQPGNQLPPPAGVDPRAPGTHAPVAPTTKTPAPSTTGPAPVTGPSNPK